MSALEQILEFEDLRKITGYQHSGDIERCLRQQGIRFFSGKSGIWTTVDLVNYAGGLNKAADPKDVGPAIPVDAIL